MGFAVDDYTIFDCIASGEVGRRGPAGTIGRELAAAFDTFTVVAFVLHDPTLHRDFDEHLGRVFETIDHETGSDLLVFALTRPSEEWIRYARRRRPYHGRLEQALSARSSPRAGPLAVHAVATRLGIPASDLPVIVLTQDLRDSGFTWVRTQPDDPDSGEGLVRQLNLLGDIANDLAVGRRLHSLGTIRASLDISGFTQVRLGTSLAEAICQALAPARGSGDLQRMTALVDIVRARLREIADMNRDELPPAVEHQLVDLEITLAYALRGVDGDRGNEGRLAIPAGLEPLSTELLVLARDVLYLILARTDAGADLSPVVMCVGKALEIELNLSVVQWARSLAGIDMPEFFGRALPRNRQRPVVEIEPGYLVDLSGRGRNRDDAISNLPAVIGECIRLLRWARQQSGSPHDAVALAGMEEWIDDLRRRRNVAAHPERVTEIDGHDAFARATDANALRSWEELVRMKRAMSGDALGCPPERG